MTLAVNIAQSGSNNVTFRNRIINGACVIDQRNAGAALTVNSGTDFFPVDRFLAVGTAASGVFTVQRSSTAPTGFINSILATVTTTDASLAATDQYYVSQIIEGLNVADLAWGTASAATVTLSFWVYSSLTGTFGGAVRNSAANRSYPFTYTISSANTWEQKSVTIAGDTTGTWLTTNGKGLDITWTLGLGSTFSGTAGVWAGANYKGASGVTNVMATNGATFYITGVQLEAGTTASPFEYRQYGTELALCQRYYEKSFAQGTAPTEGIDNNFQTGGVGYAGNGLYIPNVGFKVTKRTTATVTIYRPNVVATAGNFAVYSATLGGWNSSTTTVNSANDTTFSVNLTSNITQNNGYAILGAWTASAEL